MTVLDYFPVEYADIQAPPVACDITRANLTTYPKVFYISQIVDPASVAALDDNTTADAKRECVQTGYHLDEYLNFQGGT